jgi:hypothetical protein
MRKIIETRIDENQAKLTRLRALYSNEMRKHWLSRSKSYLVFLWAEIRTVEYAVEELKQIVSAAEES